MSHTPGPWSVEYDVDGKLHVTAGEFYDLAEVGVSAGSDLQADARLMASAPDLLEALELIAREEIVSADGEFGKVVFAAIAKARGGK